MRSLGGTLQRLCRFFSLRMIASAAVLSLYVRLFLLLGCLVVSLSPFHSPPLPLSLSLSLFLFLLFLASLYFLYLTQSLPAPNLSFNSSPSMSRMRPMPGYASSTIQT